MGDIDEDGLEDFYIGSSSGYGGSFFVQNSDGAFVEKPFDEDISYEDMGSLLFDADGDGDQDLVRG